MIYPILMLQALFLALRQRRCTVIHPCWAGLYFNERKNQIIIWVRRNSEVTGDTAGMPSQEAERLLRYCTIMGWELKFTKLSAGRQALLSDIALAS